MSRGVIQVEKCAKIEEYIAELEEYYENRWESLKNIKVKGRGGGRRERERERRGS